MFVLLMWGDDHVYKVAVRGLLRYSIRRLNQGDYSLLLKMASPDLELVFPGENSWSSMFRPPSPGRNAHVTHCGLDEVRAFADRFVAEGIRFEIEDILVNGGPWNTRIAVRAHDYIAGPQGGPDVHANRFASHEVV